MRGKRGETSFGARHCFGQSKMLADTDDEGCQEKLKVS